MYQSESAQVYLCKRLVECGPSRHLGKLSDEHGGVARRRQLKGEL